MKLLLIYIFLSLFLNLALANTDIKYTSLLEPSKINSLDTKKNHLIFLFSVGCIPCKKVYPSLSQIKKGLSNENLNFLALSKFSTKVDFKKFVKENKKYHSLFKDWEIGIITTKFAQNLMTQGTPSLILLKSKSKQVKINLSELTTNSYKVPDGFDVGTEFWKTKDSLLKTGVIKEQPIDTVLAIASIVENIRQTLNN